LIREAIKEIGYNDQDRRFNAAGASVLNLFICQAADIACGVDNGNDLGADGQLCRPGRRRITAKCLKKILANE